MLGHAPLRGSAKIDGGVDVEQFVRWAIQVSKCTRRGCWM